MQIFHLFYIFSPFSFCFYCSHQRFFLFSFFESINLKNAFASFVKSHAVKKWMYEKPTSINSNNIFRCVFYVFGNLLEKKETKQCTRKRYCLADKRWKKWKIWRWLKCFSFKISINFTSFLLFRLVLWAAWYPLTMQNILFC